MKQRFLDVLGIGCLVIALLISALWIESIWFAHLLRLRVPIASYYKIDNHYLSLFAGLGKISFSYTHTDLPRDLDIQFQEAEFQFQTTERSKYQFTSSSSHAVDFQFHVSLLRKETQNISLVFPLWFALLLTAPPGLWRARQIQKRIVMHLVTHRRRSRGLCIHCGYDLRASTDRCPECHTPINNEPEA